MQDSDLKKLLIETCPIRPGQEDRAWIALRSRLYAAKSPFAPWAWLFLPTWRGAGVVLGVLAVFCLVGNSVFSSLRPISFASANSEAPGIYATSFYSHSAKAQVVWLTGLEPATDQLTYLDPTTKIASPNDSSKPVGDPNSL